MAWGAATVGVIRGAMLTDGVIKYWGARGMPRSAWLGATILAVLDATLMGLVKDPGVWSTPETVIFSVRKCDGAPFWNP